MDEALRSGREALEVARVAGDPIDLARTQLALADLMVAAGSDDGDQVNAAYEEAARLFRRYELSYWLARPATRPGPGPAVKAGSLRVSVSSAGPKSLLRVGRNRQGSTGWPVSGRHRRPGVALSVSDDNEFKLFGKLINQAELSDIDSSPMDDLVDVLRRRTGADRVSSFAPIWTRPRL